MTNDKIRRALEAARFQLGYSYQDRYAHELCGEALRELDERGDANCNDDQSAPATIVERCDPAHATKPQVSNSAPAQAGSVTGAELIAVERQRQINREGWTPEHDDEHK